MAIRTAEQFEKDSQRGPLHHKSNNLKEVLKALAAYHQPGGNKEAKLWKLQNAIINWLNFDQHEFGDRHGEDLLQEVWQELQTKAPKDRLKDGDILFRYVSRGIGERGIVQGLITIGQLLQKMQNLGGALKGGAFDTIQHVGIYADGKVIEIGPHGLEHNAVERRVQTDLVVRTEHGDLIANTASQAVAQFMQKYWYPLQDLANLALRPRTGYPTKIDDYMKLYKLNSKQKQPCRLSQLVVCSHFVNAVMYAAVRGGTLAAATHPDMDHVFKVSPAHLWGQFKQRSGIWQWTKSEFAGVQKDGILFKASDQFNEQGFAYA